MIHIQDIELGDQVVTAIDADIDINAPVIEWSGYSESPQVDQSGNEYDDNVVMLSAETEIEEAA